MKIKPASCQIWLPHSARTICLFLFAGMFIPFLVLECSAEDTPQLAFAPIQINDHPASLLFGTALDFTCLLNTGASRLGLPNQDPWLEIYKVSIGLSAPTRVTQAGRTLNAPLLLARVPIWARPLLHLLPFRLDGLLGWPEVRDNILVFDYDQRTLRRLSQLPPETSGWVKLKLEPADTLLLDLPQPDGSLGVISLNIGLETSRTAVRMSARPWREWHAAHPRMAATNEVHLGPLTLTGVTAKEIPDREAGDLLESSPAAQSVWQLGSSALAQLDLVVDGINGWAYLHPKAPSQPDGATTSAGDWQLAENVRLVSDNLFVYSAWYQWCKQDFTAARAEYRHALQLNPSNADAWSGCGAVLQAQGDFSGAVSNYDQLIQLRPDNSEWERLDRLTLDWRLGQPPSTPAPAAAGPTVSGTSAVELDPVVVKVSQPGGDLIWPRILRLFLEGSLDEKTLLAAAKQRHGERSVAAQKAQAWYYLGEASLRQGDLTGARDWLKKCQSAGIKEDNQYYFGVAELARLNALKP